MKRFATTFITLMILPLAARAENVMDATLANDIDMLRTVLVNDAHDVNLASANGTTALHLAAAYGYGRITAELLDAGAHVDARDHLGNTPLILAAQSGHVDNALLLLAAGADRTAGSFSGGSALSYARGNGHRDLVRILTPVVPTPAPVQHWPYVMAVLSIALLAAVVSEIHRSLTPTHTLARAAH
ncbi:MAG: ankyrin repeat domain-containing protein [Gemmatimonadetes bacterium]|jgi:ankyrin repeat protein|nr:ankyrin repeat domain-containing protein [Gemmatimonadota bacterium]MBT6149326.1 ankyrin repeat domain-containing protein [Gemmatimonadota bacterium]MBT7863769.1 ankyrin repeat domain-containing protein [Gemmatimonadota bacterium]